MLLVFLCRYKRVFSVGTHAITTYNPNTLEVTNQWPYGDICSISPVGKGQGTEFNLTFRKGSGKKSETLKFSTEHRTELLTEALRFRTDFSEGKITGRAKVTPGGFDQINPATNKVLCSYDYRNIEGFVDLSDYQGGFCILYGGFSRLHLFASEQREEIIKSAIDHAGNYIGISLRIRKEPLEFEQYLNLRFGKYSTDESITSLAEFIVQKISPRHSEPIKRVLALTETCLVERDPATYNIATLKPLGEVFALVCDSENPQLFTIEFIKGQIRKYSSTERDSLLASLLDGVRASGNRDVCVKMTPTHKGQRWGLLSMPVDEEVESLHLRFLATPPNGNFADAVFRFNANISYSGVLHAVTQDGLFSENKEKLINNAITALLSQEGDVVASNAELESQFQAVRRLVASKAGFLAFTQLPKFRERLGVKVVKALKRSNNGVIHAAVDMLCALMCDHGTGALVISSLLDFLTFALCAPYSETTEGQQFDMLLEMVASNGRTLFKLFQHPSMAIIKGAGLVMKAIIEPPGLLAYLDSSDPVPEKDADRMHVRDNVKIAMDQYGKFNKVPEWQRLAGKAAKEVEKFAKEKVDLVLMHWRDRMGIAQKEVKYECLAEEIKIGDYYLRLLLEEDENEESGSIKRSYEFFNELYHRFLLTPKVNMKCLCLQALAIVYGRCHEEIGPFTDTRYIIGMLERCTDKLERDRLILFLNKLILNKRNVKDLMDSNGIRILVDLLTLAHLHVSRATVPLQSNVIEASPDMKRESEKEWYFGNADKERSGPYGFHEVSVLEKLFLLLTFDPILVEKVAILLCHIMQDNPQLPRLYLSGVFFFIMMYTGSNVLPVARFLKYTHTKQAFKSEETKGQDIFQRSILGHILPEAMVCYLENYEPEKFSEIFLGEFDTPEAIWSSEMRRLMIEKIAAHLADFTPRLQSNTRALYQYCPIPVINYPQLENELFCNIYYLKQLCDTLRFPDWPIKDPEVEKKPPTMSIDDAYEVLNLPQGQGPHDESKIRKAYFRLAQKYHPDKNPEGRDMFEKVNKAYEFLCTKSAKIVDGPDPENIILILKTQSILFNRHKEDLQPYKYAGYPMLIRTITMETSDDLLFSKESPLLPAATELAFHTVNCSALNAEELRRENGIEVCGHISKCYSVAAQFEECREKITEMPGIIKDLCRVLYFGKSIPRVAALGVECVSSFAVDFWLQTHLFQAGILWHLLGYLFNYDYTLEESGIQKSEETNQQEVANSLAKLSVRALSRLGGYLPEEQATPENPTIRKSLAGMLTPYVARKLAVVSATEILKMLNSNTESPYLIWNNSTRAELLEFLESQQENMIKKGDCDKTYGSEFVYSDHAKELIVGEIFVRVYNEVPTFQLEVPKAFAASLLDYIGSQAQYLHTFMAITHAAKVESEQHGDRLPRVEMALEALRNVIKYNPGSESECIGHFKLIFSLLRVHGAGQVQQLALEVVNIVTSNQDCVNNIAESMVLSNLLALLHSLPSSRQLVLETLYALTSSTKIIKEAMAKGALIYLLDMFCNSTHPQVRAQTAELFAKMTADKLIGPKVRITLMKFLPSVFMDAMRDNPEAAVHIFEGTHENPELIWNDSSRDKVSATVREMMREHFKNQRDNPDVNWKLPDDFAVVFGEAEGELAVGGVFLRIFIAQPAWVLRKPREFLIALLEKLTEFLEKNNPHGETLETLTMATVCLFNAQPQLADQVPPLGHLPKVIQAMNHRNNAIPKSAIRVIHALSENELCVRAMASLDTIGPLMNGMKKRPDTVGLACEAINRMFQKEQSELVAQALKVDLVPYLLKLLEGIGLENLDSPAATKAQIVKALKAMTRSLQHGEQVNEILSRSSVWSAFKDQKHDLFISETQTAGYLTGPGVAGYLTAGTSSSVMSNLPPPVDHEAGDLGYQT
ncbi:hypothetical protein GH733_002623 [Mirounga leonina]|nr:hypothetical protein GH733_002623 [Mirounga leonina]